ncbi:MAG: alpha/beta fold hydrolase [Phyllobacteriaceae bacterium]|nr:alpha/beta fold hydrolase [Phyllobacteriaceae bacterium]
MALESATSAPPQFITVDGVAIAVRFQQGAAEDASPVENATPTIVWLGGFRSDMRGSKAERLAQLAARQGVAFLRFDYSGHGESGGAFADGTISRWLGEAEAVIAAFAADRPVVLVGSSMGGWIALLLARRFQARGTAPVAMVLLAPAPDFTSELMEPHLTAAQKQALARDGFFTEPSAYSDQPNIYTRALFEDGAANSVLVGMVETHCPVTILQGMADPDVPYAHALRLVSHLPTEDVTLTLIKDGDHRLSREQDLLLLEKAVLAHVQRHNANKAGQHEFFAPILRHYRINHRVRRHFGPDHCRR